MRNPVNLTDDEFRQLVDFVRSGLLDARAGPENLRNLVPSHVPSGRPIQTFQFAPHNFPFDFAGDDKNQHQPPPMEK